jgi:hypothetical protein
MKYLFSLLLLFLLYLPCQAQEKVISYNVGAFRDMIYELEEYGEYRTWMAAWLRYFEDNSDACIVNIEQQAFESFVEYWRTWRLQKLMLNQFIQLNN